jgi:hypothetical protein
LAERLFWEQEAAGSNPVTPTKRAPHIKCGALLVEKQIVSLMSFYKNTVICAYRTVKEKDG